MAGSIREEAMPSAQDRVQLLAQELKKALKEAKAAEARAKQLGEEVVQALAAAKAEAEAASTIIEYPVGRYECKGCHQSTIFSHPYRDLPMCDNCGAREYTGAEPKVIKKVTPPPRKYAAGMYECGACSARVVVPVNTDKLSPCDLCGADKLQPLSG